MKTLVVYTHPWEESFNHFVLETTVSKLEAKGYSVDVIDLHKDGFNPAFTQDDLRLFGKGEYHDELAANYIKRVKEADEIIFVFPIWWYGMPAMLKGFFDKVMLKGQAYGEVNHKLTGLLNIQKGAVFTTASVTEEILKYVGDPIGQTTINGIFAMIGIHNVTWIHCATVHLEASRLEYLSKIEAFIGQ
ncbi:hypothetical protein AOC36_05835 [Erysipelothrix larvae]|uniref:Flavodoxin-like fold domain-containing protein n=1 Tax=Erysipelothrix larvae TaxID=1514105 RepID=A0A0X8GZY1_9FIRM|nr:NAD(P)H-dependent oxidoreductase [Erysipelothrix larvae]AMC93517.1 hypothetical protein AOC36_05835 [Erysipelothrix larvae]